MKKLFNDGWEFSRQPLFTSREEMEGRQAEFAPVGLPHDWLIDDADNLYQDGTGWYRKRFSWKPEADCLVFLRFDGVYMDSRIFVNGEKAFEWKYGYSAFEADITAFVREGENEILVSADFQAPNSRWYSGAGIFRDVWLKTVHQKHLSADGTYFHAACQDSGIWDVEIETETAGDGLQVTWELSKAGSGAWRRLEGETAYEAKGEDGTGVWSLKTVMDAVEPWDVERPVCYRLRTSLFAQGQLLQTEEQTVGFRSIRFSPNEGFCLNGRKVKLNGVCEHHDLGCLGSAYHTKAMRRKLLILKKMGVNALRLTHNMPAADVMELADELGFLVVSEAFDMWESSKTAYDYARFFPEWYQKDVASWVRRDRNHPSLIMWSIGNEIYDTHVSKKGLVWTKRLMEEVALHDPKQNAAPTLGSNYMPWENAQKCADLIKVAGYNYGEKYYDAHHGAHPDWIIYGSETASVVASRGIYHFPFRQSVLADVDEQCSALGNSTTSWGAESPEFCILAERDRPYSCGQFLWTGFDYIGEPTPYHTRNSYFGQVDTAGFAKDSFYLYQSAWTNYKKAPMVHVFPYWDFNEGQRIDVRVCTNAPEAELFLNGESQGRCSVDHLHGTKLTGDWQLPYTKGEIRAVAYDENGNVIAQESRHSFGEAASIRLTPDTAFLNGDGQDLLFLEISMEDADGFPVENANNRVTVQVEGAGRLVGLDNGDSTDEDGYKGCSRRLFSGKLLAVIKAEETAGEVWVSVHSQKLPKAELKVPVLPAAAEPGRSALAYTAPEKSIRMKWEETGIPVRSIRLKSSGGCALGPENPRTWVSAQICPPEAGDRKLNWSIVDDAGIPITIAQAEEADGGVWVTAKSDGAFRLRCMSAAGTGKIRILSQLEFTVEGLGETFLDPYGFISAGLYDFSRGELGNGNEHGVATARDGETQVGFHNIDFGPYGSDEITVPIFALTGDPYAVRIYEGMPGEENACLVADVIYQKPSVWNVYQEETWRLNRRLKGITSLCFVLEKKVHIKGFSFTKRNRAWAENPAGECDKIYGDSFCRDDLCIREIGNNVTLEFSGMEFGEKGTNRITIWGSTPLKKNTVILQFTSKEGKEERRMLEFTGTKGEQSFALKPVYGTQTVRFLFLPGSRFDFERFRFEK